MVSTAFEYNAFGRRTGIIDQVGQTWSFTYNALGLIETLTDPLGDVETRNTMTSSRTARVVHWSAAWFGMTTAAAW